jgi:hypothetical protein
MTGDLVNLEVRFLLARYGLRPVLDALAKVRKQTPEEVEAELERLETAKAERKGKPQKTPEKLLARFPTQSSEQASLIRELVGLYEQKRFLPNLRIAEDFVARRTGQHPKFKSRKAALPALLEVIAAIPSEELRGVREEWVFAPASGDFELLARAIIGTK